MQFRTQIKLVKQENTINYSTKTLLIGSCFTQNIGSKLAYLKFDILKNPLGILFQPKAIENLLVYALSNRKYVEEDLVFQNEQWHCLDVHSAFSHTDKNTVLAQINTALEKTNNYVQKASHILITLGTSWVYRYNKTANYVANCHKIPQKEFKKSLLSVAEIVQSLQKTNKIILQINPRATVIYTVSPVRHIKDGFMENQQSKAHLITAIHQVTKNNTFYFPAYEIMMDDLRDYRFYKKDMLHPNETAIAYIWDKFVNSWMDTTTINICKEVEQIQKGLAHKPFNEKLDSHQLFLKKLLERIQILKKEKGITFNYD